MFAWNCGGSASRNTRLHFSRFVASKQFRSQSSWLRDLGCHAVSCIPEENPHHRRTEAEADWSLARPWTVTLVLVLQGNVATKLSYDGKFFILVMSHFFLIPMLKEFKKSTNICKVTVKNKSGPVFWLTVYNTPCPGKNGPLKQNAVKCTVYNTIQWHLYSIT